MLSCLPESCWSACLTLVVSGSLCAELVTRYDKYLGNQLDYDKGLDFGVVVGITLILIN